MAVDNVANMNQPFEDLLAAMTSALGAEVVVRDPSITTAHAGDWSEARKHAPPVVLFPRTPEQVATVLKLCNEAGQKVVVQGGLTGLAGGATPQDHEFALSLAKLNRIDLIDAVGGTATVQAGVVLEELQQQVEEQGWYFPLDLGARGSCQVGGNAAVNAGGNRVIRYGTMRDLVLGIEVALPDGRLMTMLNGMTKNTTGIDLKHLFIGSEGTLGVITRLVVKLFPKPRGSCTALCALSSFDAAAKLIRLSRAALPTLSAFEVMWSDFMAAAEMVSDLRPLFGQEFPLYVLIECLGDDESIERQALEQFLERVLEAGEVEDAIVAQSLDDAEGLWAYRESVGELLAEMKPHAAFDVSVPMASMDRFVKSARQMLDEAFPGQRHLFFGHIGDGNLHVLSGPHTGDDLHRVEELVYSAVRHASGAISAEHGIGIIKKDFLDYSRSPEELEMMADLKRLLDPNGILNPGRIL